MNILKIQEIGEYLFDIRLSERELKLIERCMDHVLNTCSDEEIDWLTGAEDKLGLEIYYVELLDTIRVAVDPNYLPDRFPDDL